jgi:putative oxidoreductase
MVGMGKTFALDAVGAWAIESLVYFFMARWRGVFRGGARWLGERPAYK